MPSKSQTNDHRIRDTQSAFLEFAEASDGLFAALRSVRGRIADAEGLSLSQARLIEPLQEHAPVTVSALAKSAGVAVPTATRMLKGLERRGMVTRRRASHSERVVEVLLTAAGTAALSNQQQRLREKQRATFESLDANEQATVPTLLAKLTALVNDM